MSKKMILLAIPMTYAGIVYEAGENEMPQDAADYAIAREFGAAAGKGKDVESSSGETAAEQNEEFEPLSFEETMKRAEKSDFADEVVKSLQFHQETIKEFRASGMPAKEFLEKLEADKKAFDLLPKDFPMRHVFAALGEDYDSVEKIQAKSETDLIALDGIADASAKKALAYKRQEKK